MLPWEPLQEEDPLGTLLNIPLFRNCLAQIGLDPDNPAQVERQGKQTVNFHYESPDAGFALSALLDQYRQQFHFMSGLVLDPVEPPSDLPPDTVVALEDVDD